MASLVLDLLHEITKMRDWFGMAQAGQLFLSKEGADELENILLTHYPSIDKEAQTINIDGYKLKIIINEVESIKNPS